MTAEYAEQAYLFIQAWLMQAGFYADNDEALRHKAREAAPHLEVQPAASAEELYELANGILLGNKHSENMAPREQDLCHAAATLIIRQTPREQEPLEKLDRILTQALGSPKAASDFFRHITSEFTEQKA